MGGEEVHHAPAPWRLVRADSVGPVDLRGYGRVSADGRLWSVPADGRRAGLVRFTCQGPRCATVLASKYLADLLAYGAVNLTDPPPELGGTALEVRHAGVWLLGLRENEAWVASAPDREALVKVARISGPGEWKQVPAGEYPRYLDNFDNASLGIWWMPGTKSPEELAFVKDHPAVVNIHEQLLGMSYAPGVYDTAGTEQSLAQVRSIGKPFRQMLWAGSPEWFDYLKLPGHHLGKVPDGYPGFRFFIAGGYYAEHLASPRVNAILQDSMVNMMRRLGEDPDLMAWMEPHGEFHVDDPALLPPGCEHRYPAYLQLVKRHSLDTLSEAYTGRRGSYAGWGDVPYPDTAYFLGRRGRLLDLDDIPWRWKPGPLDEGEEAGWHAPGFDDAEWAQGLRESKHVLSQWSPTNVRPVWFRFTHQVPKAYLDSIRGKALLLHIMPYTEHDGRPISVWVNGEKVATGAFKREELRNRHVQIDLTGKIKPGPNRFAIHSRGGRIAYRVCLSDTPGGPFPFEDVRLNRRFLDWRDYLVWEKLQILEAYLRVMRSVDPVRPIKVMTPCLFQTEAMELFERYGAYPQLTGETNWYRPMHYKGYASLRRLPGSSEPGSPMPDARSTQVMFSNIFWESQDCHDYVFDLSRDLWPYKEVVAWWREHRPLLRTLGKTDLAEPQIGLLRDVRQDTRYQNHGIWNWDLSRGPLPALGLTPVLVDGPEMEMGTADAVPVILDCATVVMGEPMIDAVRRYVEAGGVFVAQHHTGQHTPEQRDAWPLAKAFGLTIEPRHVSAENAHQWPLGKLRFTDSQSLFPSLRGKRCEGCGVSIDWKGNRRTGAVSISGGGRDASPVALWDDGTMAVTDVRRGRGRFILVGTPFFLRFRDENGRWMNDDERQAMLGELLSSVGAESGTKAGDGRTWFERRESKNGLYDVFFAGAMQIRGQDWKLTDRFAAELSAPREAPATAIDATAEGTPDVPTEFSDGVLRFGEQEFAPYQIRQFAVVRPDVGLRGPMHWLEVQRRFWRALEPVPPSLADRAVAEAARIAAELGEAGMDLNSGWRVRVDPRDPEGEAWLTADTDGPGWREGAMGSWLTRGWKDATRVQYRKRVEVPGQWRGDKYRLVLGFAGRWDGCIPDGGTLWVDGTLVRPRSSVGFALDVTAAARDGLLDVALHVEAKGRERGPFGTMYLRRTPAPDAAIDLAGTWTRIESWDRTGPEVRVPLKDPKIFGLRRKVRIPGGWAGRPIRLVIEQNAASHHVRVGAVIINSDGYFRQIDEDWAPVGPRVDRWLKPGEENQIDLYGCFHMDEKYAGFHADISGVRLEAFAAAR